MWQFLLQNLKIKFTCKSFKNFSPCPKQILCISFSNISLIFNSQQLKRKLKKSRKKILSKESWKIIKLCWFFFGRNQTRDLFKMPRRSTWVPFIVMLNKSIKGRLMAAELHATLGRCNEKTLGQINLCSL